MLKPHVVAEVKRLLATGLFSQRKIAGTTGVSRGSVHRIATGKRPDYEAQQEADEAPIDEGPLVRCTGCGGLQHIPCRVCRDRVHKALRRGRRGVQAADPPIVGIELVGEHRRRYEEIRRRKQQAGEQPLGDEAGAQPAA